MVLEKRACRDTMLKLARGNTKGRLPENSSDKFFFFFFFKSTYFTVLQRVSNGYFK